MKKINELLGRPLLKIYQDPECFNFSIDSIILANFVTIQKTDKRIIDLCSGNAPIPLYLTLRTKAQIVGVEIQEYSFSLALESVKINNKEKDIILLNEDLKGISGKVGKNIFDIVTVNPPFFKIGENNINPDERKAIARHELKCTLDDIIYEASLLLKNGGRLALVHRPSRLDEIFITLAKYGLVPKRLQIVYPKLNKQANHILIEAVKGANPGGLKVLEPLIVYNDDDKWTEKVIKIYNGEEV